MDTNLMEQFRAIDPSIRTIQLLDTLRFLRLFLAVKLAVMHRVFIIDGSVSTQPGRKITSMNSCGSMGEGVNFTEPHRSTNNSYWSHTNDNDNDDGATKNDIDSLRQCRVKEESGEGISADNASMFTFVRGDYGGCLTRIQFRKMRWDKRRITTRLNYKTAGSETNGGQQEATRWIMTSRTAAR